MSRSVSIILFNRKIVKSSNPLGTWNLRINSKHVFVYDPHVTIIGEDSILTNNSEAFASELLVKLEEIFP